MAASAGSWPPATAHRNWLPPTATRHQPTGTGTACRVQPPPYRGAQITELSDTASRERSIEKALDKMMADRSNQPITHNHPN